VSGGDVGARAGALSIMVGGDERALETVRPVLEVLGRTIVHQGGPGAGQHTKLVNQTLVAGALVGVCEALVYAKQAGLDAERVLESVSSGAAGSWTLANLAPRAVAGDLAPGFFVDHFVKDLGIALGEARRLQVALPAVALVEQLAVALQASGHGRSGTQSLVTLLASMSGTDWP
jgi:3-hydroxyisobutyrate dehydrogenase